MALLSALNCPLMGSERRTVSTAAKTVGKEYKKFCVVYYGFASDAEAWDTKEGTFSLQCFTSRPSIGYFIISTYQGICNHVCNVAAKAGFASAITPETWQTIAQSLLVGGLGLSAEKVEAQTLKQTAEELQTLLQQPDKDHLQVYLLSLLQAKEEQLAVKDKGRKRDMATPVSGEPDVNAQGPRKKARSKERSKRSDMDKAGQKAVPIVSRVEIEGGTQQGGNKADAAAAVLEPVEKSDEEEIEAEPDSRTQAGPTASKSSSAKQNSPEDGRAAVDADTTPSGGDNEDHLPRRAAQHAPDYRSSPARRSPLPTASTDEHLPSSRMASPSRTSARNQESPQGSQRAFVHAAAASERRASPRSKGNVPPPASPSSSESSPKKAPLPTAKGGAGKGNRGSQLRKEAVSKMSPNSRKNLTKKECKECHTWYSIRATKCPNEDCGVKAVNKAAEKRAAASERKLAQKITYRKAWNQFTLAAQVLHNSKSTGARIAVLVMKKGETVDSVQTFGAGGGQRFVNSKKVQDSFIAAMREEVAEESKARKLAEKSARHAEKATPPEEQMGRGPLGRAAEQQGPPSTSGQNHSLSAAVNSVRDFSEADKKLVKSCLEKEEFDLKKCKANLGRRVQATVPESSISSLEEIRNPSE